MANPKLEGINKSIENAESLITWAYPAIREGRIIIKALNELGMAANSLLPFVEKEDVDRISSIIELAERRRKSPMEFSRKNKAVIMHEDLETESITSEAVKGYISYLKGILKNPEISQKIA